MITVTGLCKKYGNYTALDHLNFTIGENKVYGFLGPNGAGKTTTMNILTGYLQATEGTVLIDDIDIRKKPEAAKRKIGYLPENPPLYLDMTVREYLEFAAGLKKIRKKERQDAILKATQLMGLGEYSHVLIRKLSKGYKQRVGMAQAILGNPPIIILDEPTVGLDPKQIMEIRDLIHRLGKKHTVILSSHILSEIQAVCDEVLILSAGKIVAQDTPEHLEKNAGTTQKISLLIKGSADIASVAFEKLKETERVTLVKELQKGRLRYEIVAKSGCDIREDVSCLMAEHQIPILEITESKETLEDAFLRLTEHKIDDEPEKEDDGTEKEEDSGTEKKEDGGIEQEQADGGEE